MKVDISEHSLDCNNLYYTGDQVRVFNERFENY